MVARGWEERDVRSECLIRDMSDENVLELGIGDHCTTLKIYQKALNSALLKIQ